MSVGYKAVTWSPHKRIYDLAIAVGVLLFVSEFFAVSVLTHASPRALSPEVVLIRATGACALTLLHVILCIGPLARLDARFLPMLFNRRHLGVITFLIALVHGVLVLGYYHGFGVVPAWISLFTSNENYLSFRAFPFELLGVAALAVMFLMAATSHDFWLKNLGAAAWKSLHMLVYPAYALLAGHVALGTVQSDGGQITGILLGLGVVLVSSVHIAAAVKESRVDRGDSTTVAGDGREWIDAGPVDDIPESRARIICAPGGERIAVFRHSGGVSAVTNVCAHQGGPLGEGRVIDGCITCPWHGWQYRPQDGCSPPPFQEKIATHPVRLTAGRVEVCTTALPPGSPVPPAAIAGPAIASEAAHG